ncbi:MAG: indolepyruvate oxidoreductase subunit beta [Desulfoarculaceae bacterium]|nr:indolepyruvate oxidoreductase subunit beta [Desulfoarculaceae bacterium]
MKVTRVMIVAVGGQGNLLAAKVLGEAALLAGIEVRMSEIHGMAQRGGVVESAIVFGGARSSLIADGEADILAGFEPLETLRAVAKCNKNTVVITSTAPLPPFAAAVGKVAYPDFSSVQKQILNVAGSLTAFDAAELAREAGNVMAVNMVILGAMAATRRLPVSEEHIRETIRLKTRQNFVETNLKAFELGLSQKS